MLIFPLASGTYLALHDTYCFCLFFFLPFFLFIWDFVQHGNFVIYCYYFKHCIKIRFILTTEFFGISVNFVPGPSKHLLCLTLILVWME